jgi:hypothetical protein
MVFGIEETGSESIAEQSLVQIADFAFAECLIHNTEVSRLSAIKQKLFLVLSRSLGEMLQLVVRNKDNRRVLPVFARLILPGPVRMKHGNPMRRYREPESHVAFICSRHLVSEFVKTVNASGGDDRGDMAVSVPGGSRLAQHVEGAKTTHEGTEAGRLAPSSS